MAPRIAYDPVSRLALQGGFSRLADLLEVTLGPRGRLVAVATDNPSKAPELLRDGATLARRFTGTPNRFESMGALLARHIAWQVEEAVGDGTTTAVIIARHVLTEGNRLIAAGHNAMSIRRGLEKALVTAMDALRQQACPMDKPEQIKALATSITGDDRLGALIEEIFDVVGSQGAIDVRTNYAATHERDFIRGVFWNQGWVSSYFADDGKTSTIKNPYLLLTDQHLTGAEQLLPIMEKVRAAGNRGLVVIALDVTKDALNVLVANKTREILPTLAIKVPGLGSEKSEILQDLAVLSGGKVFVVETGDRISEASLDDLGEADEVQAIRSGFTLLGGKGRPAAIRERHQTLRSQLVYAPAGREKNRLRERSGKLMGGVALLKIGSATESERNYMKDRAKEAVNVTRLGMESGIVPGAGVALLNCIPALQHLALPADEAPAISILSAALKAPMIMLLRNSGFESGPIVERVCQRGGQHGFDVLQGQIVDVHAANIMDPVRVVQTALHTGVSGGLMALTTEVLVHRPRSNRHQEVDFTP